MLQHVAPRLRASVFLAVWIAAEGVRFAEARADSPEQTLAAAGLILKGRCYVVREEIQAGTLAQKMASLSMDVAAGMQSAMTLESAMINDNLMSGELGQALGFAAMEARAQGGRGRGNGMYARYRGLLNRESAIRRDARRDNVQLNRVAGRIAADRKRYQAELNEFRTLLETMMNRYDELSRRSDVEEALRTLNRGLHPKYALGPMASYRARMDSEMARILAEKGLRPRKTTFEPIEERAFVKRVEAANALALRLDKAGAATDDPRRVRLAAEIASLGRLAESLDQTRERLARDPEVADAIAELNVPKNRKRFRVDLSLESASARHILKRLSGGK